MQRRRVRKRLRRPSPVWQKRFCATSLLLKNGACWKFSATWRMPRSSTDTVCGRCSRILTKPVIAPLDQDAWTRNLNYLDSPPSELVAFYRLGRHHNLRLLRRLKVSDLSKSAFHPELQREMTVADLVERMG